VLLNHWRHEALYKCVLLDRWILNPVIFCSTITILVHMPRLDVMLFTSVRFFVSSIFEKLKFYGFQKKELIDTWEWSGSIWVQSKKCTQYKPERYRHSKIFFHTPRAINPDNFIKICSEFYLRQEQYVFSVLFIYLTVRLLQPIGSSW